ncbi:hypothetical protein N510_002345 [Firmicutes bacterium ASF500]|nr:hypothetical protein N510_002345 [Firmicutes bacterium ASF500]
MNAKTVNPLFEDFLRGTGLLAVVLSNPSMPVWLRFCAIPLLLFDLAASIFVGWKRGRLPQEEQLDMKRAETDERNLMVREKAAWLWTRLEFWLMLGAFWAIGVFWVRPVIAFTVLGLAVVHWFGMLASRWWVGRKY